MQSPTSRSADSLYIGRFAPSPTGALHFGSLVAAVGSFLEARAHGGRWLLRIEDVDTPRTVAGAAAGILATLARFGFEWDGEVVWQSQRTTAYEAALDALKAAGHAYPCACTRRELADQPLARDGSRRYPGTCRNGLPPGREGRAWRVRADGTIRFDDAVQGAQEVDLADDAGDYVVKRADGLFAYQLAVVVDDADAGVTHVVRGADLLDSTARQIHLLGLLGKPVPAYAHLPLATNAAGEKLSKQTLARAIDEHPPQAALLAALRFLGQNPPDALAGAALAELWQWAQAHWSLSAVPRRRQAVAGSFFQGNLMHPNDISAQPDAIRKLLQDARTIAIVGLSAKADRPSNEVAHRLQRLGYTIIPVNPAYQEVMGLKCYPDLHAVPEKIDIVDVFRKSAEVMPVVDEAIAVGAGCVWLQLGVIAPEAAQKAAEAGLKIVVDRCTKIEHLRLIGG